VSLVTNAAGDGSFNFIDVPLVAGENNIIVVAQDLAGNTSQFSRTISRRELVPPTITTQLSGDPATRPTITGLVQSQTPLVRFSVGFDTTNTGQYVDRISSLNNGAFTFDFQKLLQINGAPLADGQHTLYLFAEDSEGLQSGLVAVNLILDLGRVGHVDSQVTFVPSSNDFDYRFDVAGPGSSNWQIDELSLPVPTSVDLTDFVTPANWTLTYTPGSDQVVWRANNVPAAIDSGESLRFGFTSTLTAGRSDIQSSVTNSSDGTQTFALLPLRGPAEPNGSAVSGFYSATEDTLLTVNATSGLLANDLGTGLNVIGFDSQSDWGATVSVSGNGSFTYDPGTAFEGLSLGESVVDYFQYTVTGGGKARVYVEVAGRNDAPTAIDDSPVQELPELYTRAGSVHQIHASTVTGNDLDADVNDSLTIVNVDASSQLGAAVSVVGGHIVYDPTSVASLNALAAGQRTTDHFGYTVVDSQGISTSATIEILVQSQFNVVPMTTDDVLTVGEDGFVGGNLLGNDTDSDQLPGDPALAVVPNMLTTANGSTVTLFADGTFQYDGSNSTTVQALQNGQTLVDSFTYRVIDSQGGTVTGTVSLTVQGANDAPVTVDDVFLNVSAGTPLTINAGSGLLSNDSDIDSPGAFLVDLVASDVISEGGAHVTIATDGSFQYDGQSNFAYLPEGAIYEDTFTYTVIDDQGGVQTARVRVQVVGVNDAPVAVSDGIERGYWTVPNTPLTVPASDGLLVNDTDPDDGDQANLQAVFSGFSLYGAAVEVFPDGSFNYDPTVSSALQQFLADGIDVVDSFDYTVTDGNGPSPSPQGIASGGPAGIAPEGESTINGTVEIILRAGPSLYSYDIVAQQGGAFFDSTFSRLGRGPSINNYGNVGLSGTRADNVDSIFIWSDGSQEGKTAGLYSFVAPNLLDVAAPRGDDAPSAQFSDLVQLNDSNVLAAQRQLFALGLTGSIVSGIPILTPTEYALTYVEHWNGDRLLKQQTYGFPQQVAVGDGGIASSGIRWGHPAMLDLQYLLLLSNLTQSTVTGFAASQFLLPLTLQMRAWIVNPALSAAFYSPVDATWAAFVDPEHFDYDVVGATAFTTSFTPTSVGDLPATPVYLAAPFVSIANTNLGVGATPGQTNLTVDRYMTAFSGKGITPNGSQDQLFNYPVRDQQFLLDSAQSNGTVKPRIADNGTSVFVQDGKLTLVDFQLNQTQPLSGFSQIGANPSISDNGLVVFTGVHDKLKRGVFVYDPVSKKFAKIVGESGDGILDPNEIFVDENNNGKVDAGEDKGNVKTIVLDQQVGLNGMSDNPDAPQMPFYTASFSAYNGDDKLGLHTAAFFKTDFKNDILASGDFIAENRVVNIGEMLPKLGAVSEFSTYDAINNTGQIAFWVKTAKGEAVLRANPPANSYGQVLYSFEDRKLSENSNKDIVRGEGDSKQVVVGRFFATTPDAKAEEFKAIIDWGDGNKTEGVVKESPLKRSDDLFADPYKGLFEVLGDHTYKRQGPYVVTVQIQHTNPASKTYTGGLIVSMAYAVDTTNEEDIERFVEHVENNVTSSVLSSRLGLPTFVKVDANGDFEATTSGKIAFKYSYKLDVAGSGNPGEPSTQITGQSTDKDKGIEFSVPQLIARGKLDRESFDTSKFEVNTYDVQLKGVQQIVQDTSKAFTDELYDVRSAAVVNTEEKRNFTNGEFTWAYVTTTNYSAYEKEGVATIDRSMIDQFDGIVRQSASELSAKLISLPLAGNYVLYRDGYRESETTLETGSYKTQMVTSRTRDMSSTYTETISGAQGTFTYNRQDSATTENKTTQGTINLANGDYHLETSESVTNTILTYSEKNQTMVAGISGQNTVTTTSEKSGRNDTGEFQLDTETLVSSDETRNEVNGTRVSSKGTVSTSRKSQTQFGNAKTGQYTITDGISEVIASATHTTETNQTRLTITDHAVLADVKTFGESGDFYEGNYDLQETTTASDYKSIVTTTTTFEDGEEVTGTTTNGSDFVTRTDSGNRKSGQFSTNEETRSASIATTESDNQSQESNSTTTSSTISREQKQGSTKSGSYSSSGFSEVISAFTTSETINDVNKVTTETLVTRDYQGWDGGGDVLTGAFRRHVGTIAQSSITDQVTENQELRNEQHVETNVLGFSDFSGNLVNGTYTSSRATNTLKETTGTITQVTSTVTSRSDEITNEASTQGGNIVTGLYFKGAVTSTSLAGSDTNTNQTQISGSTSRSNSETTIDEVGNNIDGNLIATHTASQSHTTTSRTVNRDTLTVDNTESATRRSTTRQTGNDITGDYTIFSEGTSTGTTISSQRNQTLKTDSTQTVESDFESTETVNRISTVSTMTQSHTDHTTADAREENQTRTIVRHSEATTEGRSDRESNSILGPFSGAESTTTDTTSTFSTTNQSVLATGTHVEQATTSMVESGNSVRDTYSRNHHDTQSTTQVETIVNQTLMVVVTESHLISSSRVHTGNRITGDYTLMTTGTSDGANRDASEMRGVDTNQSLTNTFTESTTTDTQNVRSGNEIRGNFTIASSESKTSQLIKRTNNQSLTIDQTIDTQEATTTDRSGNEVIGDATARLVTSNLTTQVERDINQSLTVDLTNENQSIRTVDRTGNEILGEYSLTEASTSNSTLREIDSNQSSQSTIDKTTTANKTLHTSGNEVTSFSSYDEIGTSTVTTAEINTNQTRSITNSRTETSSFNNARTGNAITGSYSIGNQAFDEFTSFQSQTNQSLTVSATQTGNSNTTETKLGNQTIGEFSLTNVVTSLSSLQEVDRNQVRLVNLTEDQSSRVESNRRGNEINADYTVSFSTSTSSTRIETNNIDPFSTLTLIESSAGTSEKSGNEISGDYSLHDSGTSASRLDETYVNKSLNVSIHEVSTATHLTEGIGNEVSRTATSSTTRTSNRTLDRSDENQSLLVSIQETGESNVTTERSDNAIIGGYTLTESTEGSNMRREFTTNQSLTVTLDTASQSSNVNVKTGNDVLGTYSFTEQGSSYSSSVEVDANQTLHLTIQAESESITTATGSGNAIVTNGTMHEVTTTDTLRSGINSNQSKTVTLVEDHATTTITSDSAGNTMTGLRTLTEATSGHSSMVEVTSNQTHLSMLTLTASSI
ncbi:MAG: VCBS domain-containing protein, partial [Planctomycetales bacterium]|nr:VCBS domain-containing protein [Planctomycetales bacterium]